MRKYTIDRKTLETDIKMDLNLDGEGVSTIDTGIGFLDHMLTLMSFHGGIDLNLICKGDLCVDSHHTIEDIGITLGRAFKKVLGDKKGIKRYSNIYIPMDEALCQVVLDISNRPYLVFNMDFEREKIGSLDTQEFKEFFRAFVNESGVTLHINLIYGENDHHKIEAVFKAFGRVLRDSSSVVSQRIVSSKGVL